MVDVADVTADVVIGNAADVAPCATDTLGGTATAPLALLNKPVAPPADAAAVRETVPVAPLPATT